LIFSCIFLLLHADFIENIKNFLRGVFMKKILGSVFAVVFIFGFISCATFQTDPKKAACIEACKAANDKCAEEAAGDKVKLVVCDAAFDKCKSDCGK